MEQRKLKPWMRYERALIWTATIVTSLAVAVAITYRTMS
jgi:hypothetical protein